MPEFFRPMMRDIFAFHSGFRFNKYTLFVAVKFMRVYQHGLYPVKCLPFLTPFKNIPIRHKRL